MIAAHLRIFGIVHIFWLAACEVVEYKGLGVRKQRILQFLDALFTKMRCNWARAIFQMRFCETSIFRCQGTSQRNLF